MNERRPPGPENHGILGNLPLASKDPLATYTRWSRSYGDVFYYRAIHRHVYFLNHPDLIKNVLVSQHRNLVKGDPVQFSRPVFGNGLLTNEGDSWQRQRKLIQPSFHRERIQAYGGIVVDFTKQMLLTWNDGEQRNIHGEMMQLALRIVSKSLFDVEDHATTQVISTALDTILRLTSGVRLLMPPVLRKLPLPNNFRYDRSVRALDKIVYGLIRNRQNRSELGTDLLSMLLLVQDEEGRSMPEVQLRDEVMTMLLAGHETTATSLTWTWFLLSQHPEIEAELWAELDRVLGGRAPTVQDLSSLPFTEQVVKEAMRLFPPAWAIVRSAVEDCEIGGYKVPAGSTIMVSQYTMHRHPRFWSEPDAFHPHRWAGGGKDINKGAYLPFGGGPRVCIGAGFAMMEAVLILATVAQRFRVSVVPGTVVQPVPTITLRPDQPIPVTLTARA